MGMVIRTAFNNNNWSGKCKNADRDRRLFKCREEVIDIKYKVGKNGNCLAGCWESALCKNYVWYSTVGNFDKNRAKGRVFFVFPDIDNSLVLWGMSKIKEVKGNEVYFHKFKPLPPEKWVRGLSSKDLIGKAWGMNTYRYIDTDREEELNELIKAKDDWFDDSSETEIKDKEGKRVLKQHLVRERSTKLVSAFKNSLASYDCWVCGFNFEKTYGEIGANFIEAHHTKPVSALKEGERVSTKDLVAVCSNCHRMIHSKNPMINWRDLKKRLKKAK